MKRKHRHELKRNEFLVWFEETLDWFTRYKRPLLTWGGIALAAAALLGGTYYFVTHRESDADRLLVDALELYHGRIQESTVVQSASGTEFKTLEERYERSLEAFNEVFDRYPRTPPARQARYYAALCHIGLDQDQEAEKLLEDVTTGKRDLVYYLASQALAVVKTDQGDYKAAAEIYRLMVEDPGNPLPKDLLLFHLAQVNEQAGNLEEARRDYTRVIEEYPDSLLRSQALDRNAIIEYRLDS